MKCYFLLVTAVLSAGCSTYSFRHTPRSDYVETPLPVSIVVEDFKDRTSEGTIIGNYTGTPVASGLTNCERHIPNLISKSLKESNISQAIVRNSFSRGIEYPPNTIIVSGDVEKYYLRVENNWWSLLNPISWLWLTGLPTWPTEASSEVEINLSLYYVGKNGKKTKILNEIVAERYPTPVPANRKHGDRYWNGILAYFSTSPSLSPYLKPINETGNGVIDK